jgi:hypothetical protein
MHRIVTIAAMYTFSKFGLINLILLPFLNAAPAPPTLLPACNPQCCNSVQSPSDSNTASLLALLGIVLQDVEVLVGLNCKPFLLVVEVPPLETHICKGAPMPVVGVGQVSNCAQQPVCCDNNNFNVWISNTQGPRLLY